MKITNDINWSDPRVIKAVHIAYHYANTTLSDNPKHIRSNIIDNWFGHVNKTPLGNQLFRMIIRSGDYVIGQHSYQYRLNAARMQYFKDKFNITNELYFKEELRLILKDKSLSPKVQKRMFKYVIEHSLKNQVPVVERSSLEQQMYDLIIKYSKYTNDVMIDDMINQLITHDFKYTSKSGRRQYNPIQNIKKEGRNQLMALAGFKYSYDICTALPSVMHRFAMTNDLPDDIIAFLYDYTTNKSEWREYVGSITNTNANTGKAILAALFNGGKLNTHKSSHIFRIHLNGDYSKTEILMSDHRIKSMQVMIKRLKLWVKKLTRKSMMTVYEINERKIMEVLIRHLNGDVFVIHDGCYSTEYNDISEIKVIMNDLCGIQIEEEEI